jgi:hypothetical protein
MTHKGDCGDAEIAVPLQTNSRMEELKNGRIEEFKN